MQRMKLEPCRREGGGKRDTLLPRRRTQNRSGGVEPTAGNTDRAAQLLQQDVQLRLHRETRWRHREVTERLTYNFKTTAALNMQKGRDRNAEVYPLAPCGQNENYNNKLLQISILAKITKNT